MSCRATFPFQSDVATPRATALRAAISEFADRTTALRARILGRPSTGAEQDVDDGGPRVGTSEGGAGPATGGALGAGFEGAGFEGTGFDEALARGVSTTSEGAVSRFPSREDLLEALAELQLANEELQIQNEELILAQRACEEARHRYQELFEFAPDAYVTTNGDGRIIEGNSAAARLFNVPARYLVGKPLANFITPEARGAFRTGLRRLQREDRLDEWPLVIAPRRGEPVACGAVVGVTRAMDGSAVGVRWSLRRRSPAPLESRPDGLAAPAYAAPADSGASPDRESAEDVSPDAVSPDAVSPDAVSPDAVTPDAVTPDAVTPDAVSHKG